MPESIQHKLDRVRPPRVHITYDVETGDAIEVKELPFVMGVLGDFSGQPKEALKSLKERKFLEITPDNFDDALKSMTPRLSLRVKDTQRASKDAAGDGPKDEILMPVELVFNSLEDFNPDKVAKQVTPLKRLLELRDKLSELKGSLQGNDKLDELLQEVIKDTATLQKVKTEAAGSAKPGETPNAKPEDASNGTGDAK